METNIYRLLDNAGYAQHVKNVCQGEQVKLIHLNEGILCVIAGFDGATIWEFDFNRYRLGCKALKMPGFKTTEQRRLLRKRLLY